MVNEDENESKSNKKRSVVARKQPLLHSFLRKNNLLKQMKTIEKRFENVYNCMHKKYVTSITLAALRLEYKT